MYGLSKEIYLSKPAVENWAKYNNCNDYYINNRTSLLDDIDKNGKLSYEAPSWMNSISNKVEAFVIFEDREDTLLLKKQDEANKKYGKTWDAFNCVAPKSLRNKIKKQNKGKNENKFNNDQNILAPQLIEKLYALNIEEFLDNTWVSEHAVERFNQRVESDNKLNNIEELKTLLKNSSFTTSPKWGNASGKNSYCLILESNDDIICFPLVNSISPDIKAELVISTCISKNWVYKDLELLKNDGLFRYIEYSTKFKQEFKDKIKIQLDNKLTDNSEDDLNNDLKEFILSSKVILSYEIDNQLLTGPFLVNDKSLIKLYPISNSHLPDKRWVAQKIDYLF